MKQNDLLKLALLGLTAGVCLSAQSAPNNGNEIAMQCSKNAPVGDAEEDEDMEDASCNSQGSDENKSCNSKKNKQPANQGDQTTQMKKKRISAAQAAIEHEKQFEEQ